MKTLLLFCVWCCACVMFAKAQDVVLGAQGGFGSTWLINNNVSDQADNLDQVTSFGPVFGIEAGCLFKTTSSVKLGVMLEGNYSMVNQEYTGKISDSLSSYDFSVTDKLAYIQVPVLFHVTGNIFFFEVGPQFSFLSSATEKYSKPLPLEYDIKPTLKSTVTSVAFGFGGHFNVAKNFFVDARLRFAYGLTDATIDYGSEAARDAAVAGEGDVSTSVPTYYANTAQKGEYSYNKTNLATGHLLVGFTYRIPTGKKETPPVPR